MLTQAKAFWPLRVVTVALGALARGKARGFALLEHAAETADIEARGGDGGFGHQGLS